ncbi:MAG TPA: hypothetical protein VH079_02735 [Terriglobales bacterium]|jgi:hypothetical protein|nr:hypothetical protein [Terriglobales bacterium]
MLRVSVFLVLSVVVFHPSGFPQLRKGGFPTPPEAADKSSSTTDTPHPPQRVHTEAIQLERDARELSELSGSIPSDINQVNHGLLPKDTIQKLKRIEKLSKHLRTALAP